MLRTILVLVVLIVAGIYTPSSGQEPQKDTPSESSPSPPTLSKEDLDRSPVVAIVRLQADTVPLSIRGKPKKDPMKSLIDQAEPYYNKKQLKIFWGWPPGSRSDSIYLVPTSQFVVAIDSAQIAFEGGFIRDIVVSGILKNRITNRSRKAYFRNTGLIPVSTPSAVERVNKLGEHMLIDKREGDLALDLANVIDYERRIVNGSASYEPKNRRIVLTTGRAGGNGIRAVKLRKKSVLDNLDLKIFTDLAGVPVDNPNGLLQLEFKYRVQGSTSAFLQTKDGKHNLIFLREGRPYVYLSKLEEHKFEIPIDSTSEGLYASSLDFFLYSTVSAGLSANALSVLTSEWLIYLDLGLGVMQTVKTDSTGAENKLRANYWDLVVSMKRFEGRRINYEFQYWQQYLWTNNEAIVFHDGKRLRHVVVKFDFHPTPTDKYKSVFLKYIYSFTGKRNDAFSVQVGYQTPISRLLGMN